MSLAQPITFVWGPPGTGKTQTLSKLAWDHLNKGERVLMLSYSNVSVDGAILRVFQRDPDPKPGRLVRYGYSKDQNLLSHEYLTSYKLTLRNHPELCKEREQILAERKKLPRTSPSYVKVRRRLTQIREQLSLEEHRAVENASFVATTVTKAFSDKTIYEDTYDTVIFDEASMAYIPQIIFSASLAIKHFVCMGDFLQLPPIVQSDSASSLNQDIFSYCKIEKAVEQGAAHEWLCLLDTQYRMHPEIASFASCYMYRGLLKSGPELALKRAEITGSVPFKGNALFLADLSGMLSVCTKTRDQSRINCLSALLTFGLALNAAKENEVGIITPYNAQSRLLHAMSQDVAELYPGGRRITCATVHQFQGSEKDVILYDAVDCYRMPYPGSLLTTTANHLANRLYNVALTRARGKMISVVNVDYMKAKSLSRSLMFRRMIDVLTERGKAERGEQLLSSATGRILESFSPEEAREEFFADLEQARKEIYMDLDMQKKPVPLLEGVGYTSLASYVAGKLTCPECKSSLRLKKVKTESFSWGARVIRSAAIRSS